MQDNYSMSIHAAYQRDMADMNREYAALKAELATSNERITQLEQVVKEYHSLVAQERVFGRLDAGVVAADWFVERDALQERAKALVEQEIA